MTIPSLIAALALAQAAAPVLTLDNALREAREHNLDLKAASAKLDQAHEISSKVWANYLPQLSVGGSYTRNSVEAKISLPVTYNIRDVGRPTSAPSDPGAETSTSNPPGAPTSLILYPGQIMEAVIQPKDQLGAQAQLSQALIAPALWPAIRNAYIAERVVELSVESARREVLFGVAQLYYGAAGLREALAVQKRLLEINLEHEKDAKVRYEAGAAPKVALLRAQIDRAKAEQDLRRAENAYASAKSALAALLDREPDFEVARPGEPQYALDTSSPALLEAATQERPDVKAAKTGLELAEKTHSGAWLKYAPNIGFTAQYRKSNSKGFTGTYDSWALILGVNWTIWDGGLRESELRETSARVAEALATERSTEAKARDEVRRALLDLQSARANRSKAEEQLKLARENMELVKVNYSAGAATYLEVADANAALLGAELGQVGETLNSQLALLRLAKSAGAFDPH